MSEHLPNLDVSLFEGRPTSAGPEHPPRILLLYGSTRERSFSRTLKNESKRSYIVRVGNYLVGVGAYVDPAQ